MKEIQDLIVQQALESLIGVEVNWLGLGSIAFYHLARARI